MTAVTVNSFIDVLRKSGLIAEGRLQSRLAELEGQPAALADSKALARILIAAGDITSWQAEKLLTGKHKGFFLGKYKLLSLLGRGGMSAVYLAEHTLMKRRCAIKVLPTNRVNDSSYLARFHLEAQAVAALDDPNIMRAYDVDHFVDGKTEVHFLVMEYVEGRNLHDLVVQDGPLSPLDAAEYMRQAANGLAHAHQEGLVHRDIKPGNLLLDLKGTVKILDMGLARFFADSDENSLTIQHDERVLGTADFLSPEQAINSHNVDARADIYSLGCTLHFLLTRHAPFEQGSLAQRLMAHQTQAPLPLSTYRSDVPESLEAILQKMMAKQADNRYQTAGDNARALKEWIAAHADDDWMTRHEKQWDNKNQSNGERGAASLAIPTAALGNPVPTPKAPAAGTDEFGDFLTMIGKEPPPYSSDFSIADSAARRTNPTAGGSPGSGSGTAKSRTAPDSQSVFSDSTPNSIPKQSGKTAAGSGQLSGSSPKSAPVRKSAGSGKSDGPRKPFAATQETSGQTPRGTSGEEVPSITQAIVDSDQKQPAPAENLSADPPAFSPGMFAESPPSSGRLGGSAPRSSKVNRRTSSESPTAVSQKLTLARQYAAKFVEQARQKPRVSGGVGLAILVLFGLMFFWGGSQPDVPPTATPDANSTAEKNGTEATPQESAPEMPPAPLEVGDEMSVGPEGTFATLNQAITYLIEHGDPFKISTQRKIVLIEGVTLNEPLEIIDPPSTFPKKLQIVGASSTPVVWNGNGKDPVIRLRNVEGLVLEGLQINANGAAQAIQLEERCPGVIFRRCFVNDFTETGARLIGLAGLYSVMSRWDSVVFRTESRAARGIQIESGVSNVESIQFERCRFLGPFAAGIVCSADVVRWVTVTECVFHQTEVGLELAIADPLLESLVLSQNTFHQCGTAIRWQTLPARGSQGMGFVRNLFVESREQDFVVQRGFQADAFQAMLMTSPGGASDNWTTRPAPSGEVANLFANNGKTAVADWKFQSVDTNTGNFLKPANGLGKLPAATGFKPYVGAIAP